MSDSNLQQLKRAWEASGAVEDEAAYLRERVRAGELSQDQLGAAAWCGQPAARLAASGAAAAGERQLSELAELGRHGPLWLFYGVMLLFVELSVGRRVGVGHDVLQFAVRGLEVVLKSMSEPSAETRQLACELASHVERVLQDDLERGSSVPAGVPVSGGLNDPSRSLLEGVACAANALSEVQDFAPQRGPWVPDHWRTELCEQGAASLGRLLELSDHTLPSLLSELSTHMLDPRAK